MISKRVSNVSDSKKGGLKAGNLGDVIDYLELFWRKLGVRGRRENKIDTFIRACKATTEISRCHRAARTPQ